MKLEKIKYSIVLLIVIIIFIVLIYNFIQEVLENKKIKQEQEKYAIELEDNKKKIETIKIEAKKLEKSKIYTYNNPYIFENFIHTEGNFNNGFVIQDNSGNEFVWVPCTLEKTDNTIILDRYDFNKEEYMKTTLKECIEKDENLEKFIFSVKKYEGFYISRYEIGKENNNLVSKANVPAWNNISKEEAESLSNNMYNENDYTSSLVNSFAWDTTIKWIEQTNNLYNTESFNPTSNTTYTTGKTVLNNIYDIDGNLKEWTTEMLENYAVIRGSNFYNKDLELESGYAGRRDIIDENSRYNTIGFRIVLFKI